MAPKTLIILYKEHVSSLPEAIKLANYNSIDMIVTPITNPLFYREFHDTHLSARHLKFTRSDLVLEPSIWAHKMVCKLSDSIDCDSSSYNVRAHSAATVQQEIHFAQHVACHGNMLLRIRGTNTLNLARIVTQNLTGISIVYCIWQNMMGKCPYWIRLNALLLINVLLLLLLFTIGTLLVEVPMSDPKEIGKAYYADTGSEPDGLTTDDTWQWWNRFRQYSDYNQKLKVSSGRAFGCLGPVHILH